MAFFRAYDCGYGESGVHDYNLTFDQAKQLMIDNFGEDTAKEWEQNEVTFFESFNGNDYMIADCDFDETNFINHDTQSW